MSESTTVKVQVNRAQQLGQIRRIWNSIGYDELNWTYTARGRRLYRVLGQEVFTGGPYYVRMHNAFTSGNGLSGPAWGAGNPYHEAPDGSARYFWDILDRAYDTITAHGGLPLIELGFMPRDLSRITVRDARFGAGQDLGREPYEGEAWKEPPKDLARWADLVHAFVTHLVARYGEERVATWRFELWNEPDIPNYWHGTVDDYAALYDASAAAAKRAFPGIQIGGPATTDHGTPFLDRFLTHLDATGGTPDFLSFHSKGASYAPRRLYSPFDEAGRESPSTARMVDGIRRNLATISRFPQFDRVPVYIDECDPAVGTIYGVYDNPNFVVTNTEYYPSFVCHLVASLLDLERIDLITHWAFYMEGKRWFEGNRTLADNENVEKPIMNGLRLLERLTGGQRLHVTSTVPSVGGLAVSLPPTLRVLLWHHDDAWWAKGTVQVDLEIIGAASGASSATLWRLDRDHANTYRMWQALGAPDDPTPEQLMMIREAGLLRPERQTITAVTDTLHTQLHLPKHGIALLEVEADD